MPVVSRVRPAALGGPAMAPPRQPGETWLVVAGGGTIGHLTPGLATAEALVAQGVGRRAVAFVGSQRGVEAVRLPAAGYEVALLPGRGLQRHLTPANLGALWGLVRAYGQARRLLRRHGPAVVLATGGYASAPCALAAAAPRIPVVVAEQNAVLGAANRLALRVGASAAALSFADTPLPDRGVAADRKRWSPATRCGPRCWPSTAPVSTPRPGPGWASPAIAGWSSSTAAPWGPAASTTPPWPPVAAGRIAATWPCATWSATAIGTCWRPRAAARPDEALVYQPVRYEEAMPACFAAADLVIGRAGASTVAELTAIGLPSVLVPLPRSPGDHQAANAAVLERAGAALVVADAELDGDRLVEVVDTLLAEPSRLVAMATAAARLGRRDAAVRVADLVIACASRPLRPRRGGAPAGPPPAGEAPAEAGPPIPPAVPAMVSRRTEREPAPPPAPTPAPTSAPGHQQGDRP